MTTLHSHTVRPLVRKTFEQSVAAPGQILVLCAVDDNYVMPLTVMLQSAARHVGSDKHIHVLLIDGGITPLNLLKLEVSLAQLPITVHLVEPDHSLIEDLVISHHATHSVYFRLLASLLLPDCIDRIIYLDADMIIQDDISELWDKPLQDHYCLAVPDIACPYISARHALPNYKQAREFLAADNPVQNWGQLGLDPTAHYFNSGVMVINLKRWRDEQIEKKLLATLRDNEKYIWCWDQYALNVVFCGQWGKLPYRWNQGAQVFQFPDAQSIPIPEADFLEMKDNPAVIHYTTEWKPWKYNDYHPLREFFLQAMDETVFGGWRPEPTYEPQPLNHESRLTRFRRNPRKFIRRNLARGLRRIPGLDKAIPATNNASAQRPVATPVASAKHKKPGKQRQEAPLLMFVHLPKCAGTTLIKSLSRLGPNRHLIVSRSGESKRRAFDDLESLIAERHTVAENIGSVSGHDVFLGMHSFCPSRPHLYATVLRDPLSRYISHYRFLVDCALNKDHIIHDHARRMVLNKRGEPITLKCFTERKLLPNTMATYLAAANHPDWSTGRNDLKDAGEILQLAEGALQHMDFIGMVEEFPTDLEQLCGLVNLKPAAQANRSSHAVRQEELDNELREMILDNNRLDTEVYEIGRKLRQELVMNVLPLKAG